MTRLRAIFDKGTNKLVDWVSSDDMREAQRKKSAQIVEDTVEPFMSHATSEGLMFDSMSRYKEHLDQHGFEITGGSHLTGKTVADFRYKSNRTEINDSVQEAMRRVKYGMEPFTEREKHQCLMEQRQFEEAKKRY